MYCHPAYLTSVQSMRNAGLDEAQAGIMAVSFQCMTKSTTIKKKKIAGRNINTLRYTDNTTLMAESEEELKKLLMKVKGE